MSQYLKFWQKLQFQNLDKNENIEEHSICNFSTNFFGGQENSSGILPKVSPKL